ncbi:EI24 domain-containing protein [Polynucleobacter sp. AP-RePozz3-80-G7]|uniref:EI24 domain-containing protein n=1 Tax=Polynucleobacter sp. AP-RePozz3-80-G7 TaxID=2689105 RepID=UPI001C0CDF15|nr:EI24 domain-containing protein [Polynucleobacter sp. AP-RePozz3-80-G7]MBU3638984.1 EI24 domain-containing protein [Polynucleobacter sp. AP-RePozz3-80-G7]
MVGLPQVFKSFGMALVGTMHPRMLWLSFRPFLIVSVLWGCLIWLTWTPALETLSIFLTTSVFTSWIQEGLVWAGFENARAWIAPLFFVMLIIPLITISLLVFIAFSTVPSIVKIASRQSQFQDLERKKGGGFFGSLIYSLWSALICLALVMLTLPVWWVPPLVAVLPPLLWGWLTMRLMSYDVLAKHASAEERDLLLQKYRWPLFCMGIASGMLGAVPTFFWATSALALVLFPIVSFIALWIYSLIFVFAALWFSYFLLDALKELREEELDQALTVQSRVVDMELPYHG